MRAIIDGDIIAFLASCVEPDDFPAAKQRAIDIVEDVIQSVFTTRDQTIMYVKGDGNFRMHYDDYKSNRGDSQRPDTLEDVRTFLGETYGEFAHGAEADDYCTIEAQRCLDAGIPYVICGIDKDLKQMPGLHANVRTGEIIKVTEEEGYQFLLQQCLTGDSVDGIEGLKGIGPKKSIKILEENANNREEAIALKYIQYYGDDAYHYLKKCYNLVYMRRRAEDLEILELPETFNLMRRS